MNENIGCEKSKLLQIASPARYTVTIGGTHLSMRVLSRMGLIPTTTQVKKHVSERYKVSYPVCSQYLL